jgi:hypothetical protein
MHPTTYNSLKYTLLCILFLSLNNISTAQTSAAYEAKANESFEIKDYNSALGYYRILLEDFPSRFDLYYNAGECARETRAFNIAETYFERLASSEKKGTYEHLDYKLGLVKKSLGKYDEAISLFEKYKLNYPKASFVDAGTNEIEVCKWAKEIVAEKQQIEIKHFGRNINSIYPDLSGVYFDNKLFYTSAYNASKESDQTMRIYSSDLKANGKTILENSEVEKQHTANMAISPDGKRMYYSLCELLANGNFKCQLYYRDREINGDWKKNAVKLPEQVNTPDFNTTQPAIGFDAESGKDILYYASDRTGGKGGMDIWFAAVDGDKFGTPINISSINTSADEITPYFLNGANILYFSSTGYKGLGGFDIYKSTKSNKTFSTPEHTGYPLNSSYDDTYYSFNQPTGTAFFTSNRPGGMCDRPEKDCINNDIYSYEIKVDLNVRTLLKGTDKDLAGCKLELLDLTTGKIIDLKTAGASYGYDLQLEHLYRIIATKTGYMPDTVRFDTKGIITSTTINKKLFLQPNLKLTVYVFDAITKQPINASLVKLYDARTNMQLISQTLTSNIMYFNGIEFGKRYKAWGYKDGFSQDSSYFVTDAYGTSNRFEYTDSLYLTPFTGLPVTLYFDNDYPNPRTRDTLTSYTYDETYEAYYPKQQEFLSMFYKDNRDISAGGANEIQGFFTNEVKVGYDKLMEFSSLLVGYLAQNHKMEIVVEGYASPIAKSDYNVFLSARRISSVINHFKTYNGGVLYPYLTNGLLSIRVLPYGNTTAPASVSGDPNNRKQSVYSVEASRERRVVIKEINNLGATNTLMGGGQTGSVFPTKSAYSGMGYVVDLTTNNQQPTTNESNTPTKVKGAMKKRGRKLDAGATINNQPLITNDQPTTTNVQPTTNMVEVVMVDSYTGEIIKNGNVLVLESTGERVKKNRAKLSKKASKYYYKLSADKDYTVKANVVGYSESAQTHYTSSYNGNEISTDTLYLTPFNGLPLSLFFDNDHPNPNTTTTTTNQNYDGTYYSFIHKKGEFLRIAANNAQQQDESESKDAMANFFDISVKGGFEKLGAYTKILNKYLSNGSEIEIVLEGHASPLSTSEYNEKLIERRLKSVQNYFEAYNNGAFKKYIKSGKLKLTVDRSASTPPPTNLKPAGEPIFSVSASKERKVMIKDIKILNNSYYHGN